MGDPLPGRLGEGRPPRSETRVGSFLERELSTARANDSTTAPNAAAFHRKNPALVQRELSDITIASPAKAKFRMTSDRHEPQQRAVSFDKVAMNAIRNRARPSTARCAAVSCCMPAGWWPTRAACAATGSPQQPGGRHRALSRAPGATATRREAGRRDQRGDPAGIQPGRFRAALRQPGVAGPRGDGRGVAGLLVFIRQQVIVPVRRVREFALAASNAEPGAQASIKVDFIEGEHTSRNENP